MNDVLNVLNWNSWKIHQYVTNKYYVKGPEIKNVNEQNNRFLY